MVCPPRPPPPPPLVWAQLPLVWAQLPPGGGWVRLRSCRPCAAFTIHRWTTAGGASAALRPPPARAGPRLAASQAGAHAASPHPFAAPQQAFSEVDGGTDSTHAAVLTPAISHTHICSLPAGVCRHQQRQLDDDRRADAVHRRGEGRCRAPCHGGAARGTKGQRHVWPGRGEGRVWGAWVEMCEDWAATAAR